MRGTRNDFKAKENKTVKKLVFCVTGQVLARTMDATAVMNRFREICRTGNPVFADTVVYGTIRTVGKCFFAVGADATSAVKSGSDK